MSVSVRVGVVVGSRVVVGFRVGMSVSAFVIRVLAPAGAFFGFLLLTLAVSVGGTPRSSRRVRLLVAYVVFVSTFAGLTGRDFWPFAAWRFAAYDVGDSGTVLSLVAIDDRGREVPVDAHAFEPLEGGGLLDNGIGRASDDEMRARMQLLLGLAQANLARAHSGLSPGTFSRVLGPFAAPQFQVVAAPWSNAATRPTALTDLRAYRIHWRIHDGMAEIERRELVVSARP
jgi:hypothetical protein